MHVKPAFLCITLVFITSISFSQPCEPYHFATVIHPENVTIVRDSFGVPHVFGKTDADAAYGLAWANAEDAFETMQESLLAGKGMMGRMKGAEGAKIDFFAHAIGAKQIVNERFFNDLTPEYIRYVEGYCQGINAFAKKHPDRVLLKKAFPVTPKDIMQAYVLTFSALTGVAGKVGDVLDGNYDPYWETLFGTPSAGRMPLSSSREMRDGESIRGGSNAFAMNKNITTDGSTYLCINPHMKVEGPFSFYEAHLCSREGLNITGTLFQGGTCVFMGCNENIGWAHTFNHFDGVDVYALKMHPKNNLEYELDGKYYPLTKRPVWLKVKIKKWLPAIPVRRVTYWSRHFGPVLKSKGGRFYSVRGLAFMTIKAGQQFYYMNKARNFSEFRDALKMQGLAMFNIIYADREGNIYYLHNGLVPDRKAAYDWKGLIPGNNSNYLWEKPLPVDSLPHTLNPACGYVFNMNNTPFNATCYGHNDDPRRFPGYVEIDGRPCDNNRSMRFMELLNEKSVFTFEDFKRMKFDYRWPQTSQFQESVKGLYAVDGQKYPDIADVIAVIKSWDKSCDTSSTGAAVFGLMLGSLLKKTDGDRAFTMGIDNLTETDFVNAYRHAKAHLVKHFGTVEVPLGKLQRYAKGGKDYAIPGFPDALMANYPRKPHKNGSFKLEYGDTFIQFVKFPCNGEPVIESLLPYQDSPSSCIDQTRMYQQMQTKTMSLSKDEVMKKAVRIYQPE
ncbi:MAG TPA: penicillin acylase family protein [Chitinophagales bacterium]|nr:penicillin acylase family protein [Chitinophagales bacterium]